MKVRRHLTFTLAASIVLGTSAMASASTSEHNPDGNKANMDTGKRNKLSGSAKNEVLAIFKANESLHSAFFNYDSKKVAEEARKVAEAIAKLKNPEIKKMLTFSEGKLKEMMASRSRDEHSQNYHLVSMALIHVLKNYDVGDEYNAYSCPMVKKKWVQNSSKMLKVHNPYAGDMPHCGSQDTKF